MYLSQTLVVRQPIARTQPILPTNLSIFLMCQHDGVGLSNLFDKYPRDVTDRPDHLPYSLLIRIMCSTAAPVARMNA